MDQDKILVVEEDASAAQQLACRLQAAGYTVLTARDQASALLALREAQPALLILAISHQWEIGETIRAVRRSAQLGQIGIIVLDGGLEDGERVALLDSGADDYVARPVGQLELVARIQALLRRRRSRGSKNMPSWPTDERS